jgi:hypothetical protein
MGGFDSQREIDEAALRCWDCQVKCLDVWMLRYFLFFRYISPFENEGRGKENQKKFPPVMVE